MVVNYEGSELFQVLNPKPLTCATGDEKSKNYPGRKERVVFRVHYSSVIGIVKDLRHL
jgi:hypothetical protein